MPIFDPGRREKNGERPMTTAERREARAAEWSRRFPGPAGPDDYRRAFLRYSPLAWDIVQASQQDLLALAVGRVPAEIGVPVILALNVLFTNRPKGDDAARATLAMIVNDLEPAHARTLLVGLADSWQNSLRRPYDRRRGTLIREFDQVLSRLAPTPAGDTGVVPLIRELIQPDGVSGS